MNSSRPIETSGNRGGRRANAGRKKESHNRLSMEAREKAQATGLLPHEILLSMARGEPQEVYVPLPDGTVKRSLVQVDLEQRRDAAKAAAPYYAPKISTVEVISGVGDDELDAIIKGAAAAAGVSLGLDGEGEEDEPQEGEGGGRSRNRID